MTTVAELRQRLKELVCTRTLIVCMGNPLKSDDGAGPALYENLRGKVNAETINAEAVPENYIQRIIKAAPQNILIIDAVDFRAEPGEFTLFAPDKLPRTASSTHALSPRLFADMISKSITANILFIGIQPANVRLGQSLSPEVEKTVTTLSDLLISTFRP